MWLDSLRPLPCARLWLLIRWTHSRRQAMKASTLVEKHVVGITYTSRGNGQDEMV